MKVLQHLAAVLTQDAELSPGELTHALDATLVSILITDNTLPDNPIVYCNKAFENITGYTRDEVIGYNSRFLQGDKRDNKKAAAIKKAMANGKEISVKIINFKRDGTPFWNELHISPVKNRFGRVTHFISIQLDITHRVSLEDFNTLYELPRPSGFKAWIDILRTLLPRF